MTALPVIIPPVPCSGGCRADVSERAIALPGGGLYCMLCGGVEAVSILDNPKSSKHDREMAESALNLVSIWRKLDLKKQAALSEDSKPCRLSLGGKWCNEHNLPGGHTEGAP